MGLPRSHYVQEGEEGVYHCITRCVRRAFLCGVDTVTGQDFSHRKAWLVDRLRYLAACFAIEVCAYAVMSTHHHNILRVRPDLAASWSDQEVARRWLTLFPRRHKRSMTSTEEDIRALADQRERIAILRQRLCNLSWFMGRLNESIARAANKEDKVKGRFWESRFKCQALLDDAATASCMVYVDLNLIRAGLAATPEESDFTSIQERIRAWRKETAAVPSAGAERSLSSTAVSNSTANTDLQAGWLCPIHSESGRRGILQMTAAEYFDLVDRSGRMMRSDKRGVIDADLAPILLRIGVRPDAWPDTVSRFGSRFRLAAGLVSSLRDFADRLGRRWFQGSDAARAAFSSGPPKAAA
jgi:hypothetical protein